MKISVIVPSFNQAAFLEKTLESILSQEGPFEVIVQDGGSADGSVEILKKHGSRVVWESAPDAGQTDALNKGFRKAAGDVFCYLNSDDMFLPGAFAEVRAAFLNNPSFSFVYGRADFIDPAGRPFRPYPTIPFDYKKLLRTCFICQPACFWRRDAYDRVGEFDASLHYTMDYEYWLRAFAKGEKFFYLEKKLAQSRYHPDAKSAKAKISINAEALEMLRRYGGPSIEWMRGWVAARASDASDFPSYLRAYFKFTAEISRLYKLSPLQQGWILWKMGSSWRNRNRMRRGAPPSFAVASSTIPTAATRDRK